MTAPKKSTEKLLVTKILIGKILQVNVAMYVYTAQKKGAQLQVESASTHGKAGAGFSFLRRA